MMNKHTHTRRTRRVVFAAAISTLVVAATIVGGNVLAVQRSAANRVIQIDASYRRIPSLAALAKQSDLIVVGQVLDGGATHFIVQPTLKAQPLQPASPGQVPAKKADLAGKLTPGPIASKGKVLAADPGLPVTTYTIGVTTVLQGPATPGARISLSQTGGTITIPTYPNGPMLSRTIVFEHDPLMTKGELQVLFLKKGSDGTYFTSGGPQGRFNVVNGLVYPVDLDLPVAKGHEGQKLADFISQLHGSV